MSLKEIIKERFLSGSRSRRSKENDIPPDATQRKHPK
jgi:hypothetical protein